MIARKICFCNQLFFKFIKKKNAPEVRGTWRVGLAERDAGQALYFWKVSTTNGWEQLTKFSVSLP